MDSNIKNTNFWLELPASFSILAPMEDVTDSVFRQVVLVAGAPDVFFTEFTNCDGICSIGQAKVMHRLYYTKSEKEKTKLVAQIWGANPENYFQTAKLCLELGFDGIDINMGCPEKNVIRQGACSALINNQELAVQIIEAVQRGCEGKIPVSVKTRIGFEKIQTQEWISFLAIQNIQALSIHCRTVKEGSEVANHFEEGAKAVQICKQINPKLKVIVNGDIQDCWDGLTRCKETGADGYMIGRGIFKNPWCFNKKVDLLKIEVEKREVMALDLLELHLNLWQNTWESWNKKQKGELEKLKKFTDKNILNDENLLDLLKSNGGAQKNYPSLKKYFKIYISGFVDSASLRVKLMETTTIDEALVIIKEYKRQKIKDMTFVC
jgi:tRNA-dihydrouridine synthase